jgi:regulation of enolase protein 1 (concanavalin A-like superfamily)
MLVSAPSVTRTRLGLAAALLVLIAFSASAQSLPPTAPPQGWFASDVGGGDGTWTINDDGFFVGGRGRDIWGTADSFFFLYQPLNGDGEFRARIPSVIGDDPWAKFGLMLRASPTDASAPHHFLLASAQKGLAYQRRLSQGGTSLNTSLGAFTEPVWFQMIRTGGQVQLSLSADGVNWKAIATVNWPAGPTYVGFAVTSHSTTSEEFAFAFPDHIAVTAQGNAPTVQITQPGSGDVIQVHQPATIRWNVSSPLQLHGFDAYFGVEQGGSITYEAIPGCTSLQPDQRQCAWASLGPPTTLARVLVVATDVFGSQGRTVSDRFTIAPAPSSGLPDGWSSHDIGSVSAGGTAGADGRTFTVDGSGADIWSNADEFQFVHRTMSGDFSITARVALVENINPWTKAGLMVREGLTPGARHASFFATPSTVKGTAFQFRSSENGLSSNVPGPAFAPPVWLKLMRIGWAVTAYYRHSITDPWTMLHRQVFDNLADTLEVGLAVSSHVDGRLATGAFDDVLAEPLTPWQVGAIASNGSGSYDGTIFFLAGQGSDIWGTGDSLFYGFVPWVGDGTMTARVRSLENSHPWAKAGVMFRESTTPGSKHVFALLSAGNGANLQYRLNTSGQSASAGTIAGAAPGWVRLTRAGDTFTASLSVDGRTWKQIGTVTVPMGGTVYVGIAHTSHNTADAGGASFDDMRMTN